MKTRILIIAILAAAGLGLAGTAMADHGDFHETHEASHHPGDPACSECSYDPATRDLEPQVEPPSRSVFDMLFGVEGTWRDDGTFVPNSAANTPSPDPSMDAPPSVSNVYGDWMEADDWLEDDEPISPYDAAAAAALEAADAAWAQADAALAALEAEKAAAAAKAAMKAATAAAAQAARAAALGTRMAQMQGRAGHAYVPARHMRAPRVEMRR